MVHRAYLRFKQILPQRVKDVLSVVNQRLFARRRLKRKYGAWFDVDWRKKFHTMSDAEWIRAYDDVWKNHHNDCLDETDSALILHSIAQSGKRQNKNVREILEIGCGFGTLAIAMAKEGYTVTCLDVSTEALRKAESRALRDNISIRWEQGFAENIPFPDKSFDVITCCHTLEHVKDLAATIRAMKRVARVALIIVVPKQTFRLYAENYHTQFFPRKEDLIAAFGLPNYDCSEIDCLEHEGEFQGEAILYVGYL
jgi:2-polyprenyl-3-methyl-5-hydroxy-6-metoxy-1,4-benzoquinol methylase